jgi:hypothetical protein
MKKHQIDWQTNKPGIAERIMPGIPLFPGFIFIETF